MSMRLIESYLAVYAVMSKLRNLVIIILSSTTVCLYLAVVFLRNFPVAQAGWLDELTRFLNVWVILLGAGAALRVGGHATLDFIIVSLPKPIAAVITALVDVVLFAFILTLVVVSWPLVGMNWDQQSTMLSMVDIEWLQGWPLSMGWPYLALPIGFTMMLFDMIALRLSQFAGLETIDPMQGKLEAGA